MKYKTLNHTQFNYSVNKINSENDAGVREHQKKKNKQNSHEIKVK